jgi:secreted PhoX family phosphatase
MGDDARFEYIYKFVSRDRCAPAAPPPTGTCWTTARCTPRGLTPTGKAAWLALTHGQNGLTPDTGFADQAEVVMHARLAASAAGATPMDRPEWIAVHPQTGEVFVTLTNNSQRGAPGRPAPDAANPRANNLGGHIIRWTEAGGDAGADRFRWSHFVLAGDPGLPDSDTRYPGAQADPFGCAGRAVFRPRRAAVDPDRHGRPSHRQGGTYANLGNNALLCADIATGQIKRFLTGPAGCEITGCVVTPDRSTLFVNIQHPGETRDAGGGTPNSAWPDGSTPGIRAAAFGNCGGLANRWRGRWNLIYASNWHHPSIKWSLLLFS